MLQRLAVTTVALKPREDEQDKRNKPSYRAQPSVCGRGSLVVSLQARAANPEA